MTTSSSLRRVRVELYRDPAPDDPTPIPDVEGVPLEAGMELDPDTTTWLEQQGYGPGDPGLWALVVDREIPAPNNRPVAARDGYLEDDFPYSNDPRAGHRIAIAICSRANMYRGHRLTDLDAETRGELYGLVVALARTMQGTAFGGDGEGYEGKLAETADGITYARKMVEAAQMYMPRLP